MAVSSQLVALALAGLVVTGGCRSVCDQDGLRAAAEKFAAGEPGRRMAGLKALQSACPTLPDRFAVHLFADRPTSATSSPRSGDPDEDPAWRELLARTCRPASPSTTPPFFAELDVDVRRVCDLDRYGLQVPGTTLARQDIVVFMLHEWLLAGHVDRARAAEVTRPLLTASTLAAQQLVPPRSTADLALEGGVELRISPTAVVVDDEPVLALVHGRAARGAFVEHFSPTLRGALAEANRRRHPRGERARAARDTPVAVLADRATPMITILDALASATRAGLDAFELVVDHGEELRGLHLLVTHGLPRPTGERPREAPLELLYVVHADSVEVSTGSLSTAGRSPATTYSLSATCAADAVDCHDIAGLASHAKQLKDLFPNEIVAIFQVDGEVPLQAFVALLDLVRGDGCELLGAFKGNRLPDECRFWQPILDVRPRRDQPPAAE